MDNHAMMDEALILRVARFKKGQIQYTDTSNAELLIRKHGDEIRYCNAWKKWLIWDGKRWEADESNRIYELVKTIIRDLHEDTLRMDDYRDRLELEKHAVKSEAVRRRKATVEAASWEQTTNIKASDIDRDQWLLNVQNGTIDLRTGECREQHKDDFISKMADVEYLAGADCLAWKAFLRDIMDYQPELIDFLQVIAGWTLTGDVSEQTMFILYGSGANGKSTFLNTLMELLGDYAISTPTETFMRKSNDQISNDIARLRGTRLVTTIEAEQGRKLSEPLIKQVTGNDRLTARFLYGEFFDFSPTFKIYMATNHKPIIRGNDHGIWRRIKLIPFTVTIPPEKRDLHLQDKFRAEFPGILNWMIEGCRKWQETGLVAPAMVNEATDGYRAEMDGIGAFFRECCVQRPELTIRARELFKAYQEWCDEANEKAISERYFGIRLNELGLEKTRTQDARYWRGIALKA